MNEALKIGDWGSGICDSLGIGDLRFEEVSGDWIRVAID
jgi:hypothetical protein